MLIKPISDAVFVNAVSGASTAVSAFSLCSCYLSHRCGRERGGRSLLADAIAAAVSVSVAAAASYLVVMHALHCSVLL